MRNDVAAEVVVSKRAAASWARQRIPAEWHPLIESALAVYGAGACRHDAALAAGARAFVDLLWQEIAQSR
jgi:hypothetical protein